MANFKVMQKLIPASPDPALKANPDSQATLARFAHINKVIDELDDYGFYEHDFSSTNIVDVTTSKGIIEFTNFTASGPSGPFNDFTYFVIAHPSLLSTVVDVDQVYIQLSVYYNSTGLNDDVVPYVIATGALPAGREFKIYNAATSAANDWTGLFYIYYEIKVIN
jgi:hypothetical protein